VEDDCNWAHVEPGESIALQSAEGHKTLALREPGSSAVVSGEFSKKADHGRWFGDEAKNHQ